MNGVFFNVEKNAGLHNIFVKFKRKLDRYISFLKGAIFASSAEIPVILWLVLVQCSESLSFSVNCFPQDL